MGIKKRNNYGGHRKGSGRKATGLKRPILKIIAVSQSENEYITRRAKLLKVSIAEYCRSKLIPYGFLEDLEIMKACNSYIEK